MVYHPPVIFSKERSTKSPGSVSPVPVPTGDVSRETIRKRPTLYGSSVEKADDLERARRSAEETELANSISEKKLAVPKTPTQGSKKSRPPNFDDNAIKWVGRVV
jgi:hypothetical protein